MQASPDIVQALDRRIAACLALPLQVSAGRARWVPDPFTETPVLLNPARRTRPQGAGPGAHDLCQGRTTPTLLYATPAGGDGVGAVIVEEETATLDLARRLMEGSSRPLSPAELVGALGLESRPGPGGSPVPLTLPREPWLARGFLNLVPGWADPDSGANAFVIGVPPEHHDLELGLTREELAADSPAGVLPPAVIEGLFHLWLVLEAWSTYRGLVPVAFINGGRSRLSGQSISCFHAQFLALPPDPVPPVFEFLRLRRAAGECPLCALLGDEGLRAATVGRTAIIVHPAPARDLTLLVVPEYEAAALEDLENLGELAAALGRAVRMYEVLLGGLPAYVAGLRSGGHVGHLHLEIVPRSGVNVPAGFEETTGFSLTTRDPYAVAAVLRERLGSA